MSYRLVRKSFNNTVVGLNAQWAPREIGYTYVAYIMVGSQPRGCYPQSGLCRRAVKTLNLRASLRSTIFRGSHRPCLKLWRGVEAAEATEELRPTRHGLGIN